MEIIIDSLEKRYGANTALKNISMTVGTGMFGLLGRNGAGKSTLMRILSTLAKPDKGTVIMNGIPLGETKKIRTMVGYLPQDFSFYPNMTVAETMQYLSVLSELSGEVQKTRIPELLERVNLWEYRKKKVKALSGGMKRRLGIAQALLHDPDIVIADEPTAGLDPEERLRFYDLLEQISQNKIVIVSTHIVADIEASCSGVGVLDSGTLLFCGRTGELSRTAEGRVFELTVPRERQAEVRTAFHVLSAQGQGEDMKMRVLSGRVPEIGVPVLCAPAAEDGYMELLRRTERGETDETECR